MLYLRTQTEVLAQVKAMMRDSTNARWTDVEIYMAMNDALASWTGRVAPVAYTLLSADAGTYGYVLPSYVHPPFRLQVGNLTHDQYIATTSAPTDTVWSDVLAYTVEREADNYAIRWGIYPPTAQARVAYLCAIGPLPTTVPTLSTTITDAVTTLTHTGVLTVGESGWTKIEQEWLWYGGVDIGATTTVLATVARGENNTTAAAHNSATPIAWGIPATSAELYQVLLDHVRGVLHEMYLTNAAPGEQQRHQQMVSFYQEKVRQFWARWRDPVGATAFGGRIIPGKIVGVN